MKRFVIVVALVFAPTLAALAADISSKANKNLETLSFDASNNLKVVAPTSTPTRTPTATPTSTPTFTPTP